MVITADSASSTLPEALSRAYRSPLTVEITTTVATSTLRCVCDVYPFSSVLQASLEPLLERRLFSLLCLPDLK